MRSLFLTPTSFLVVRLPILVCAVFVHAIAIGEESETEEVFRPQIGEFPPLEKAHAYRGELTFVDHANRRGSVRVQGAGGTYFRNAPHPFAMLPYGMVRYHGAPADLRDIPLGTVLHIRGFLPPDPQLSAVPVLPIDNKKKTFLHFNLPGIYRKYRLMWANSTYLIEHKNSRCGPLSFSEKKPEVESIH